VAAADWLCEAYGPEGLEHGARCFFSPELGDRACDSPAMCSRLMAGERRRVFRLIQELAAAGDPVGLELAADFDRPDQLLGGEE
jgi:hypothetical protein